MNVFGWLALVAVLGLFGWPVMLIGVVAFFAMLKFAPSWMDK